MKGSGESTAARDVRFVHFSRRVSFSSARVGHPRPPALDPWANHTMKTITKLPLGMLLLFGVSVEAGQAAAAPQTGQSGASAATQTPGSGNVPSYKQELAERYRPLYRSRPLDRASRLDSFPQSYRYRPNDRFALPLNRSGVYRSWPRNYYRRVTPYYDGRGYGVPSTSPFRYHEDLDGRIRSRR